MTKTATSDKSVDPAPRVAIEDKPKTCFVIMPISDQQGYKPGHFTRVYHELIKPAIEKAGFVAERADTANQTHNIILSILKSIVDSDMAICDVSALNPNVMYELGIRQMAKKPVVLIKDAETRDIFDITILKYIKYQSRLRVDEVRAAIEEISVALTNTFENKDGKSNSLLDLLNIDVQVDKTTIQISSGEKLILQRLERLEQQSRTTSASSYIVPRPSKKYVDFWDKLIPGAFCTMMLTPESANNLRLVFITKNGDELVFIRASTLDLLTVSAASFSPTRFEIIELDQNEYLKLPTNVQQNIRTIEKEYGLTIVQGAQKRSTLIVDIDSDEHKK